VIRELKQLLDHIQQAEGEMHVSVNTRDWMHFIIARCNDSVCNKMIKMYQSKNHLELDGQNSEDAHTINFYGTVVALYLNRNWVPITPKVVSVLVDAPD